MRCADLEVKKASRQVKTAAAKAAYGPAGYALVDLQAKSNDWWESLLKAQELLTTQMTLAAEADAMRDELIGVDPTQRMYQTRNDASLVRLCGSLPEKAIIFLRESMVRPADFKAIGEATIARAK